MKKKKKYKYDIVLIGYIGLNATALISEKKQKELEKRYPNHFIDRCKNITSRKINKDQIETSIEIDNSDILVELGEGGLYTGLWNASVEMKKGFRLNRYDILICQETIEVCEYFDMNPYSENSDGAYLLYTGSSSDIIDQLSKNNIPCRVIGYVTEELAKEILRDDDIQCLDKPRKEN